MIIRYYYMKYQKIDVQLITDEFLFIQMYSVQVYYNLIKLNK